MKKFILKITKASLFLGGGAALAQTINFAFTPIITRIYSPEQFGILGIFTSILTITSPFYLFNLPQAIVVTHEDSDASDISHIVTWLAISISALTAILCLILVIIQPGYFTEKVNFIPILYFLALAAFANSLLQIQKSWSIREKSFPSVAKANIAQAASLSALKITAGLFYTSATSLIASQIISIFIHFSFLKKNSKNPLYFKTFPDQKKISQVIHKNKDFIIFNAPQSFIEALTAGLPILIIGTFFSTEAAGNISLANMVIGAPLFIISLAFQSSFLAIFKDEVKNKNEYFSAYKATQIATISVSLIIFLCLAWVSPLAFPLIFGLEWKESGHYARILAISGITLISFKVAQAALMTVRLQGRSLIYSIISTTINSTNLLLSSYIFSNPKNVLISYVITSTILNLSFIAFSFLTIKKHEKLSREIFHPHR